MTRPPSIAQFLFTTVQVEFIDPLSGEIPAVEVLLNTLHRGGSSNVADDIRGAEDLIVRELERSKTGTDEWHAKLKVMKENLEHHIEEASEREVVGAAR